MEMWIKFKNLFPDFIDSFETSFPNSMWRFFFIKNIKMLFILNLKIKGILIHSISSFLEIEYLVVRPNRLKLYFFDCPQELWNITDHTFSRYIGFYAADHMCDPLITVAFGLPGQIPAFFTFIL